MMKQLAHQADEKWKSVPASLDGAGVRQPQPAIGVQDPGGYVPQTEPEGKQGVISGVEDAEKIQAVSDGVDGRERDEGRFKGRTREERREESPFKQPPRGAAGEDWKPKEWTPGPARRG